MRIQTKGRNRYSKIRYNGVGPTWDFVYNAHDTPCRLCSKKSYPYTCDFCQKTCCINCKTIDAKTYAVKCNVCLGVHKEKTYEQKMEEWAAKNNLAQCHDCGEYVADDSSNVFEDNEVYCKGCMKYMKSLIEGEQN